MKRIIGLVLGQLALAAIVLLFLSAPSAIVTLITGSSY